MAGRHIKALATAHYARDEVTFAANLEQIADEEDAKRHGQLAADLRAIVHRHSGSAPGGAMPEPPYDADTRVPLVHVHRHDPAHGLDVLQLELDLSAVLRSVVLEVPRWPELTAARVPPRRRLLLHGPPGCGKTSVAKALAAELERPLVVARMDSLISSYLGQTSANLSKVLEYAAQAQAVVLLDEFDSLGQARDVQGDHGELRRIVNVVLQLVEGYAGRSLLVAATNHDVLIDPALWRRFDVVSRVAAPSAEQMLRLLTGGLPEVAHGRLQWASQQMDGLSYAAGAFVVAEARRASILRDGQAVTGDDVRAAVELALARPWGMAPRVGIMEA